MLNLTFTTYLSKRLNNTQKFIPIFLLKTPYIPYLMKMTEKVNKVKKMYGMKDMGGSLCLNLKVGNSMKNKIGKICVVLFTMILVVNVFGMFGTNNVKASVTGLIAYWSFDDSSNLGNDESGNGNDGVNFGAVYNSDSKKGGSLEFDDVGDYMSIGSTSSLGLTDTMTVAFWVKIDSQGSDETVKIFGNEPVWEEYGDFSIFIGDGAFDPGYKFFSGNNLRTGIEFTEDIIDQSWHHIVVSHSGTNVKLYVDGELDNQATNFNSFSANTESLEIGTDIEGYESIDGRIDEFYIYDRVLSLSEIQDIYDVEDDSDKLDFSVNNYDISFTNQNPSVGEKVTIFTKVSNNGDISGNVLVNFYVDNQSGFEESNLLESKLVNLNPGETKLVSMEWSFTLEGTQDIFVELIDQSSMETNIENNIAFSAINVGSQGDAVLYVTFDNVGITKIEPGKTKTLTAKVYCYSNSIDDVSLNILNSDNLSISVITPSTDLVKSTQPYDFLIKVNAPLLDDNSTVMSNDLIVQAVGGSNIYSNAEPQEIIVGDIEDVPGFTTFALVGTTLLGALVAFFRRRNGNREI